MPLRDWCELTWANSMSDDVNNDTDDADVGHPAQCSLWVECAAVILPFIALHFTQTQEANLSAHSQL